jgi:hypothetical protein
MSVLAVALALPATASAAATFQYSGPATTIARGKALKFTVQTTGKATIRISGTPATNTKGLLTGPTGTWVDVHPTQTAAGVLSWTAPKGFLISSRPGSYWWQAYSGSTVGPVRKLNVTLPSADRGRGKLYPRFGKRGHGSFYLSSANWPESINGLRFQAVIRTAAHRWGLRALSWTTLKAGRHDGFNVAGFSNKVPKGALGQETEYSKHGKVIERDILLRADADWNAGPGYPNLDQVDLESVLLHELGHFSGIKKHRSHCANSPMIVSLGSGEWWRGPKDHFLAGCSAQTSSANQLFRRRVVKL